MLNASLIRMPVFSVNSTINSRLDFLEATAEPVFKPVVLEV
jgi:hypothetical protein